MYKWYTYSFDLVSEATKATYSKEYKDRWNINFTSYYNPFAINYTTSLIQIFDDYETTYYPQLADASPGYSHEHLEVIFEF